MRTEPGFERARVLEASGEDDAAKAEYLRVLESDPAHAGALNGLGSLLYRTGYRSAARTAFAEAVRRHPQQAIGHANLAAVLADDDDLGGALRYYRTAVRLDPGHLQAHQSLAVLSLRAGDEDAARRHGRIGFGESAVTAWPYRGEAPPVPLLAMYSALGGNVDTQRFIDDRIFARSSLVAEFTDPSIALPPHTAIWNAIGDADRCRIGLERAAQILAGRSSVVINPPERVLETDRVSNAARLGTLAGVVAPRTASFPHALLGDIHGVATLLEAGFSWPVLLRAPGFHTGKHFVLVSTPAELAGAVAEMPGNDVLAIAYVDTRDAAGDVRKYRVMIVDGTLYPLHLAISRNWKVHYFTADMAERDDHRAEEAAFLDDMPATLGATAMTALAEIARVLGLDYGGIDFTLDAHGRVVVFEANATMIVPPPHDGVRWDYRRPAVARIHDAVVTMLRARATAASRAER